MTKRKAATAEPFKWAPDTADANGQAIASQIDPSHPSHIESGTPEQAKRADARHQPSARDDEQPAPDTRESGDNRRVWIEPAELAQLRQAAAQRMKVHVIPNDKGNPPGKLADAELHFSDGPLEGLKLIGFAIWERRSGGAIAGRNVTFPARQYSINGERRSFALLRPIADVDSQQRIRDLILEAFAEYEERAASTT